MKYQIVIKINYDAMDDIEAKTKMYEILQNKELTTDAEIKLQEKYENKPPRGIAL
jgi:hypothetical protein